MLIRARYVLPITSTHIEDGAVLVQDGRIKEVGQAQDLIERYPHEELKDFGLAALMPGFINAHTKLEMTVMRGLLNDVPYAPWKAYVTAKAQYLSQEEWQTSARLGAYEALSSGVTTVADITKTGASVKALQELGMRAVIYREVGATASDHVESQYEAALATIKKWEAECDSTRFYFGLAAAPLYTCHPEMLKKLSEYGSDGSRVAMYLAGSREEYAFIHDGTSAFAIDSRNPRTRAISQLQSRALMPTGVSPVQYASNWGILNVDNLLAIYGVHVDENDINRLKDKGANIVVCPVSTAKLSMGIAPIMSYRRAGLTVALGTDSAAASDGIDTFEEMKFGMLSQRALANSLKGNPDLLVAKDMIEMFTIEAAKALGIDDELGSLDEGKRADIIAIDLASSHQIPTHYPNSAIVNTAEREDIRMVMIDGQIQYEDHTFRSHVDLQKTHDEAEVIRVKLRL